MAFRANFSGSRLCSLSSWAFAAMSEVLTVTVDLISCSASRILSWKTYKDSRYIAIPGSCHKRQKPQAPTPQAPIRNRQTRKVANAKGLNRNTDHA